MPKVSSFLRTEMRSHNMGGGVLHPNSQVICIWSRNKFVIKYSRKIYKNKFRDELCGDESMIVYFSVMKSISSIITK